MAKGEINKVVNLRSTQEERIASARKAGLASGESRRKRSTIRACLGDLMTMPVVDSEVAETLSAAGLTDSYEVALAFAALSKAVRGDVEAMRFVRDSLGEKPTEAMMLELAKEEKPVAAMDLSQLTDEELEQMVAARLPRLPD